MSIFQLKVPGSAYILVKRTLFLLIIWCHPSGHTRWWLHHYCMSLRNTFFRLEHRPDTSFSQNQSPWTLTYLLLTACWCKSNQPRHLMWDIRRVALAATCVISLDDICQCIPDSYPCLYTMKLFYFCLRCWREIILARIVLGLQICIASNTA